MNEPHENSIDGLVLEWWMLVVHVNESDVLSKSLIVLSYRGIEDEEKDIKSREQRSRQVDVLDGRDLGVVSAVQRICGGEDRGSCVEGGRDTSFGDGDGLLLHDFVNGCSV